MLEGRIASITSFGNAQNILSDDDIGRASEEGANHVQHALDGELNDILAVFSVRKDDFGDVFSKALKLKDFATYKNMFLSIAGDEDSANLLAPLKSILPKIPQN